MVDRSTARHRAMVAGTLYCQVHRLGHGPRHDPDIKSALIANAFNLIIVMWFGVRTLEKISSTVVLRIERSR